MPATVWEFDSPLGYTIHSLMKVSLQSKSNIKLLLLNSKIILSAEVKGLSKWIKDPKQGFDRIDFLDSLLRMTHSYMKIQNEKGIPVFK